MQTRTEKTLDLSEEIAYRSGFCDGAKACYYHTKRLIEVGLSWIDVASTLENWFPRLDCWREGEDILDGNDEIRREPPKP